MAELVYVLCALMSLGCLTLLLRSYVATRQRLLFWASMCFGLLAVNNVLLVLDRSVVPLVDMSLPRTISALLGIGVLLYGLVLEA